jgi:hypothetical protein
MKTRWAKRAAHMNKIKKLEKICFENSEERGYMDDLGVDVKRIKRDLKDVKMRTRLIFFWIVPNNENEPFYYK